MGSVDTTKREVEEHESKTNPHSESASAQDLNDHQNAGNPHPESASLADARVAEEIPTVATSSDLPSDAPKGAIFYVEDEGNIYVEDGK